MRPKVRSTLINIQCVIIDVATVLPFCHNVTMILDGSRSVHMTLITATYE